MSQEARITVQVKPAARQNKILGFKEGLLFLNIAAPPIQGKANQELVAYLSNILGVPKSCLIIEKGITSRRKQMRVNGLSQTELTERIREFAKAGDDPSNGQVVGLP